MADRAVGGFGAGSRVRKSWKSPKQASGRAVPYPVCDKTASEETHMSWLILVLSGVLEAVWATALGKSEGFSRLGPSAAFVGALTLSMAGLAYAMRELPVGTSYAV